MPLLTGRTENLPSDVVINAGVIMLGSTVKGTTVGGIKFDPGKVMRPLGYDGKTSDVVGGDRIVSWDPVLSFVMQELGDSTTGNQLGLIEPGSTQADAGHASSAKGLIRTVTPKAAGILLAANEYLTDLYAILQLGGAGVYNYARLHFPYALCTKYDIQSADAAEVKVNVEVRARLAAADAIATPGKCPYVLELSENLPS